MPCYATARIYSHDHSQRMDRGAAGVEGCETHAYAPLAPDPCRVVSLAGKLAMEVHMGTAKMEVTPGHTNTEDEINLEVRTPFFPELLLYTSSHRLCHRG